MVGRDIHYRTKSLKELSHCYMKARMLKLFIGSS